MTITDLSAAQLRQAADLKDKIESLKAQLAAVMGGDELPSPIETSSPRKKWKFSAAGLARLRAGQKARWAKVNAGKPAKPEKEATKENECRQQSKNCSGWKSQMGQSQGCESCLSWFR